MISLRHPIETEFVSALVDAGIHNKSAALAEVGAWFECEWIFDPFFRDIAAGVLGLARAHEPVTTSTLAQALYSAGHGHGLIMDIAALIQSERSPWYHLPFFARRVYDQWRRIHAADETLAAGQQLQSDNDATLDDTMDRIAKIPDRHGPLRINNDLDAFDEILNELDGNAPPRLTTGLSDLDRIVHGFCPGNLIVVGAATSAGKSAFLGHLAARFALAGHVVTFHSLEITERELYARWARWISGACETDRRTFLGGLARVKHLREKGLLRAFCGASHIDQIERQIDAYQASHGLAVSFIDYVQLVRGGGTPKDNRERQVSDITRRLKCLATACRISVFCAAPLNREGNESPRMHHLRESGAIEQDADVVCIIDPQPGWKDMRSPDVTIAVPKNRHGATGTATVR